ncbi:MAG: protoheme IX farnesyltransferase, partial [Deltaproteobacteria bacterium]
GLISVISVGSYVLLYTPLKKKTELCTVVGAVPGALPALAGWTAARGTIDPAGILLFAILFLWQVPHFFAIGWIYREDYANAQIPILPVTDPTGARTAFQSILFTALLFLVSLLPTLLRMTGWIYLVGAMGLGGFFLVAALRFRRNRTIPVARKLFFASILYLPLLWAFMVIDKV